MKKAILSIFMFAAVSSAFAQKSEISAAKNSYALFEVNLQAKATMKKQLEVLNTAKTSIDKAVLHDKTKGSAEAWSNRGLIYSAIAVTDTVNKSKAEEAMKTALESIAEAKKLDAAGKEKNILTNAENNLLIYMQNKGVKAFNTKNYKEAFNAFKYMSSVQPQDSLFTMYAAYAANNAQMPEEAITYYEKSLSLNKKNPVIYQELSRLYLSKADTSKALKTIEEGREGHPENLSLILDELNIYLNKGQVASQISKIENAVNRDPKNKTLHFVAGIAYNANKQPEKAAEAYKKAIELDPNYTDAILNLSILYIDKANVYINEANKLPNNKSTEAKYNALKGQFEGELKKALPLLERARELNPKDVNVLNTLREVYVKLNRMDKATQIKKELGDL
ncbi:tetratricopeptide repeat protein [Pseudopedobacter beijingensis]|uniref:Tetratricopeptide repeat protein n=1 Tax=Pseudopedobacter beijingensis TaxID=1207056 RepID=A0ABW4IFL8_9SPHI